MTKKIVFIGLTAMLYSLTAAYAGTMGNTLAAPSLSSLYLGAFGGYGLINGAYKQDGNFAQGMLTLGFRAAEYKHFMFGIEGGVQSGNNLRLNASPDIIEAAGGLPIQGNLKPVLDLLVTLKSALPTYQPVSLILKGGIAYRQLQFTDRTSIQDTLSSVNGEFQAGLGYQITDHAMLTAFYQGIYSSRNAGITINSASDTLMSAIPTQQAGFLGVEYSL